ncbi:protein mono-ADP-ribosyltransferase PARP3 [Periophthalmus magnuspinnatus]|uniref:Poly [ADP-ribose] polymerase n=1 Tax=Periophthalmus magnuspinnatus TaxID=409849 RepID=A0A3B3ZPD0_9GOBI|nr:protein mono-ADP-ribosyltransferase PARP3 [Periophthalmus magnuspinnatus]XP_055077674.1 protein mono-ADP-ribosyltransferase PARP3 [Periophthalmus magnuspinnatus]
MAPKRRAAAASTAAKARGKRVKKEPETPQKPKDAFTSTKEALKAAAPEVKGKRKVDEHWYGSGEVYEDYDCMLNQTNIGHNNNKFYVIQVIKEGPSSFHTWTRWGRVGETGQNKVSTFKAVEQAIKEFEKKFKDKTKNNWSDRDDFVSHPGKYTLIEVDGEQDAEVKVDSVDGRSVVKNVQPCTLDKPTQKLIELIFSTDMFKEAMEEMNLDIKKMPLGKLSKMQIAKGFDVLEEIEAALNQKSKRPVLEELSSKFFTTIPHNFGRTRPPTIDSKEIIEKKKEMLMVLADIELAQTLKSETEKAQEEMIETVPHPADQDYHSLNCDLTVLDKKSQTYKIIEKYLNKTKNSYSKTEIVNVWEVNRFTEGERFSENDRLENRRLLWHGTNIAVVAAILKSGLRIMPHSGGRVGRGIYFASENAKSAGYVAVSKNTGIMFLNEVALGKEYTITTDDSSLKKAPKGFDSVVARGIVEPDPSQDVFITLDGKQVAVPQGPAIAQPQYSGSSFSNSEYLIYKESQCRIRYLLELHMTY